MSAIMPMIEPMAATIETIQQMTSRTCRPHHLADHIGILFCTMCIWICRTGQVIKMLCLDIQYDWYWCLTKFEALLSEDLCHPLTSYGSMHWIRVVHLALHSTGKTGALTGRKTVRGAKPMAPAKIHSWPQKHRSAICRSLQL